MKFGMPHYLKKIFIIVFLLVPTWPHVLYKAHEVSYDTCKSKYICGGAPPTKVKHKVSTRFASDSVRAPQFLI